MIRSGLYRALLLCYPAPFRQEYGVEMQHAFHEQLLNTSGSLGEALLWTETFADLLANAPKEHFFLIKNDLIYAWRNFAAHPLFPLVAVLSLALGIGANTAIFSLFEALALRPLPVEDPHSLVMLTDPEEDGVSVGSDRGARGQLSYPEFEELRARKDIFRSLMATQSSLESIPVSVGGGVGEEANVRLVSQDFFQTLGVRAWRGRTLSKEDKEDAALAVISHDFWQRRFGGRPDVLGTKLNVRQGVFEVVGVTPPGFFGERVGRIPDLWLPLTLQGQVLPGRDWLHDKPGNLDKVMWLQVFGRLQDGLSLERAQSMANAVFKESLQRFYGARLNPRERESFMRQHLQLRPGAKGASSIRSNFEKPLGLLLAASAMVLLIACMNLGNLMLARATARIGEVSVRLALGASRGRIVRQWFTESFSLALLGGMAGIAMAALFRAGLIGLADVHMPLPPLLDMQTVAFCLGLSIASGLAMGLLPALRSASQKAALGLREQGRGGSGGGWMRVGRFVVVAQVALSLPLLIGAGLFLRTLENLNRVDIGFAKERLLMMRLDVESGNYPAATRQDLYDRLQASLQRLPGVKAVSYSKSGLFLGSDSSDAIEVEGYTPKGGGDGDSRHDHVGPGFFSTMGIPILLGREINEGDRGAGRRACMINEAFAKRFFAGRNPIGMHITNVWGDSRQPCEIVGVARDSRKRGLRGEVEHRYFVPVAQPLEAPRFMTYAIRTMGDEAALIPALRRLVYAENPNLPISTLRSMEDLIEGRMSQDKLVARLSFAFGVVALLLAAIGLYGVLSFGIARRTQELGIRQAMGAQQSSLLAMVLRETSVLLLAGLVAGALLACAGMRLLSGMIYGVKPEDPLVVGMAVALLLITGLAAALLPAYRASRVDPLVALRYV
jgi:predicted permease